ncbi:hypothetical protein C8Q76DRAFT_713755 [Earliella scabrosa]|nr:hypothetical protein C8Q76DRAFT_713755 [Earliella scabrosa]
MTGGEAISPLSPANMPKLRYLHISSVYVLPQVGFSTLTHLAISNVIVQKSGHPQLLAFISSCPMLESIFLNLRDLGMSPLMGPLPPVPLPRLRRVTLQGMSFEAVWFYLPFFSPFIREDFALQVMWHGQAPRPLPWEALLPRDTGTGDAVTSLLAIAAHPLSDSKQGTTLADRRPPFPLLSVTTISPKATVRVAGDSRNLYVELNRIVSDHAFLACVRHVWLTNIAEPQPLAQSAAISALLAAAPALETITIVVDHTRVRDAPPCMRLLPKRSERAAGALPVRTLRLVHGITYELFSLVRTVRGDGRGVAAQENRIMPAPPPRSVTLHLSRLAAELATGEYNYFEELVVQTSGLLSVDEGELAEVRKHFAVARAEHIAALPSIPVPDYCWEPAGNAQKMFPGSFW